MTSRELIRIGRKLWGDHGWQKTMAASLQVDASTIRRWIAANHIPPTAALALKYLEEEFDRS